MHYLAQEYAEIWRTPDKQGKLEPTDEREGFTKESPRITKNENGQLFAVMAYYQMHEIGILPDEFSFDFLKMLELSEVPFFPGLYYRRYKDSGIRQSHDNIVAIVAGSLLFRTHHAAMVGMHGLKYGWCFNVQEPNSWDIRTCLQGGDIAFIKLCNGWVPTIWEVLWFTIGRIVVPHDAGKVNLSQLRFKALRLAKERYKTMPTWVWFFIDVANVFFDLRHKEHGRYDWAIDKYFFRDGLNSIYIKLQRLIK